MSETARSHWALIADRGSARICSARKADWSDLQVVEEFNFEAGRAQMHEGVTDRAPRLQSSGTHGSAVEPHTDHAHATAEVFARQLLHRLDAARHAGEFGALTIAAPPLFLGVLRAGMSPELRHAVAAEHHHDFTKVPVHELAARLAPAAK